MHKFIVPLALIGATLAAPALAQSQQPPLEPLLASFQSITATSTWYSHCKPKDVKLTDEQIVNLASNNVIFRSLLSGYLKNQHKDVSQPRLIAFIKAASLGIQVDTVNGLKQQGCDGEVGQLFKKQITKMASEDVQASLKEKPAKLTLEQARKFLDSLNAQ